MPSEDSELRRFLEAGRKSVLVCFGVPGSKQKDFLIRLNSESL